MLWNPKEKRVFRVYLKDKDERKLKVMIQHDERRKGMKRFLFQVEGCIINETTLPLLYIQLPTPEELAIRKKQDSN